MVESSNIRIISGQIPRGGEDDEVVVEKIISEEGRPGDGNFTEPRPHAMLCSQKITKESFQV